MIEVFRGGAQGSMGFEAKMLFVKSSRDKLSFERPYVYQWV